MSSRFKIEDARSSNTYNEISTTTKYTRISVRKFSSQNFFRASKNSEYSFRGFILEVEYDQNKYLVERSVALQLEGLAKEKDLILAVDRSNAPALIPIGIEKDGRPNSWIRSLRNAVELSKERWVRTTSMKEMGSYIVTYPDADLGEPIWPDMTMEEILNLAFDGLYIDSLDHPVIRHILGKE